MGHGYSRWLDNPKKNKTEYLGSRNMHSEFQEFGKKKVYSLNLTKLDKMDSVQNM